MSERKESLANKYRSQTIDDIVEQDTIKAILKNQIRMNNIKHAYLFTGSAGVGKTSLARLIGNAINNNVGRIIELDCATHNRGRGYKGNTGRL